jgi:polyhydroxyalkanoate synthesis regulator phasin
MSDQATPNDPMPPDGSAPDVEQAAPTPPTPPKRSPGHRGQDVRDTVAELAARAHEISLEAGSKMSSALKDVINAAAGITAFAVESARDLVQYMVRRGQMTQEEADKLIHEAEEASRKRPKPATKPAEPARPRAPTAKASTPKPATGSAAAPRKAAPAAKKAASKASAKKAPAKPTAKK